MAHVRFIFIFLRVYDKRLNYDMGLPHIKIVRYWSKETKLVTVNAISGKYMEQ